eukprot:CAMPEP_0170504446 /NCGR_PEP_ID=MMETSP0208-20121228/47901_1 /TAXON_ID=197538 /ORGANISM="Strombidium inclinatum, Strain S3" /LENGTH=104 /DNA_ID=CAMNT_0010784701 /DNA_START=22 /DNA_END=336 /DNA_ORIENTATION=-
MSVNITLDPEREGPNADISSKDCLFSPPLASLLLERSPSLEAEGDKFVFKLARELTLALVFFTLDPSGPNPRGPDPGETSRDSDLSVLRTGLASAITLGFIELF